jgi:hypothetical protein
VTSTTVIRGSGGGERAWSVFPALFALLEESSGEGKFAKL